MGFYIVQPAIKESRISQDQLTVLGTSYTYVKGIAGKDIKVIVSK
ncbi:putative helicase [Stutzerimonas stutzeri NF13]|uniref:Putative helicase n=2 Tax=Stutzerimonas stutzeri TaxID=316 RepID=M2VMR8_STUST|nr:putative helicase [Stutzerimonas stutzeri NF13]